MLKKWVASYHAYLIWETESLGPKTRWIRLRVYTLPWTVPMFVAILLCVLFQPDERSRMLIALPLCAISLFGIIYVNYVLLYYGARADIQRMKAARSRIG